VDWFGYHGCHACHAGQAHLGANVMRWVLGVRPRTRKLVCNRVALPQRGVAAGRPCVEIMHNEKGHRGFLRCETTHGKGKIWSETRISGVALRGLRLRPHQTPSWWKCWIISPVTSQNHEPKVRYDILTALIFWNYFGK
jgi:hypothetical protein